MINALEFMVFPQIKIIENVSSLSVSIWNNSIYNRELKKHEIKIFAANLVFEMPYQRLAQSFCLIEDYLEKI